MGQPQKARKVAVDFMGAKQFAWVGKDGAVLKEKGLLGMTLEKVSREKALDGFDLMASADLTEAASIRANRTIDHPDALKTLTVRLDKIHPENLSLAGDRQRYRHNLLTIEKETLPASFSSGAVLPEHRPFLRASPFIQSDDREIRRLVRHLVSPEDNDGVKARKLMTWVYRNVEKRPVLSIPNALETLRNRVGDCNEHAVLLAALGRAAGIPTQI
ncbi:MAG: transglutaminase-like domain-containing protein, partial [Deltaproteobacteria bacterium]|nr:transglutaminase-like domain-containing protein [Deltaproteobacteria bacterium]